MLVVKEQEHERGAGGARVAMEVRARNYKLAGEEEERRAFGTCIFADVDRETYIQTCEINERKASQQSTGSCCYCFAISCRPTQKDNSRYGASWGSGFGWL